MVILACYSFIRSFVHHYNGAIMSAVASQISSVSIVCSTVGSGADQRKHQSSASLTFVRGIQRWPVTKTSNEENVSIWWRHHDHCAVRFYSSSPVLTQILLLSHVIGAHLTIISPINTYRLQDPPPLPRLSPLPVVGALKFKFWQQIHSCQIC